MIRHVTCLTLTPLRKFKQTACHTVRQLYNHINHLKSLNLMLSFFFSNAYKSFLWKYTESSSSLLWMETYLGCDWKKQCVCLGKRYKWTARRWRVAWQVKLVTIIDCIHFGFMNRDVNEDWPLKSLLPLNLLALQSDSVLITSLIMWIFAFLSL